MQSVSRARRALILGAVLACLSALADAQGITSAPPATYVAPAAPKSAPQRPIISGAQRSIRLPAPTPAELAAFKALNARPASRAKNGLAIGFGRDVPSAARAIAGSDLAWQALPGGTRVARIDVSSPGAAAVRIALSMNVTDPDVTVRFSGVAAPDKIFGPFPANRIAGAAAADGAFWTPVLEGDTGAIEIELPASVAPDAVHIDVLRVSHLAVAGAMLQGIAAKTVSDIGTAGGCEVDVACVAPSQALRDVANSTLQIVATQDDGRTLTCTATLVNDSITSFTPYVYTANHCVTSQGAASNLNAYWFFDATSCNNRNVPPYVLTVGGAMLLGRSVDYDWELLRLRDTPPSGARFSAWRADPVVPGLAALTVHHPEGDLKKVSQGTVLGYIPFDDGSSFIEMLWSRGSTEPGSSGAGLFTMQSGAGYYELRGGLFEGTAACTNPGGTDEFSRLDKALPVLRQYLTPNDANPNGEATVVEFYNRDLDHYFMSANPAEINDLDTGVHPGWVRTGYRFLAYVDPALAPPGVSPVCRFYLRPEVGDSHFYSADPAECAATAARFGASWIEESPSVFWIRAARSWDRGMPGHDASGVPVLPCRADEPSLHGRGGRAQSAARDAGMDSRGLRAGCGDHVLARAVTPGRRAPAARSFIEGDRVSAGPACIRRPRASGRRSGAPRWCP